MNISRRQFLTLTAMSLMTSGIKASELLSPDKQGRIKDIGIALYTVRDLMTIDPVATLSALAQLGYKEIEFFQKGYHGLTPKQTKGVLDDLGLVSPSRMIRLNNIGDDLNETLDMAEEVGHKHLVMAYLGQNERKSLDDYKAYVDLFNRTGEETKKRGIQFAYHSHDFEFQQFDNVMPYKLLLDEVDSDLMKMTMDLYWFTKAGQDPIHYINKYPKRFTQCHVKDMNSQGVMVEAGLGIVDFKSVFALREMAGFEHFYIEFDKQYDGLQVAKNGFNYLQQLRF